MSAEPISTPPPPQKENDRIIIRPWPKVIFLYPTMIAALVGWFASFFVVKDTVTAEGTLLVAASNTGSPTIGWIFCIVLGLNLLVFAFDFSRIKSITIVFIAIALVFALMWANNQWEVMGWVRDTLNSINLVMNTQFYAFVAILLCFMFFLVFVNTRFNYYEINRNEILHHHGYLGDIHRTPTTAMRMQKEIYDLLEYALLRSGRLIFYPSTTREALVIDNVIGINVVEDRIKHLLSSVSVALRSEENENVPM